MINKYSYFIYGIVNEYRWVEATCFFIRKKHKIYLVSASHVFSGTNVDHSKSKDYPDTLYLRLKNTLLNKFVFIPIDISITKDTISDFNYYEKPDVFIHEFSAPKGIKIHSIEKFIKKSIPCEKVKQIITSGYPINPKASKQETLEANPITDKEKVLSNYCQPIYWTDHKSYDSINYLIHAKNGIGEGCSGAPIYFVIGNNFYFGGLITVGTGENNAAVVRPQYVLSLLPN